MEDKVCGITNTMWQEKLGMIIAISRLWLCSTMWIQKQTVSGVYENKLAMWLTPESEFLAEMHAFLF